MKQLFVLAYIGVVLKDTLDPAAMASRTVVATQSIYSRKDMASELAIIAQQHGRRTFLS